MAARVTAAHADTVADLDKDKTVRAARVIEDR